MRYTFLLLLLPIIIEVIGMAFGTCVLRSDFGFIVDCNFRKTGLFRVRNLGGLKAHFGLGFSLGDELGFTESLGNLEGGRRRALNYRNGVPPNNIGVLPGSKQPIAQPQNPQPIQKNFPVGVTPRPRTVTLHKRPQGSRTTSTSASIKRTGTPLMTEAAYLPMGIPAFKPIPPKDKSASTVKRTPTQSSGIQKVTIQANTANVAINNKVMEPAPFRPVSTATTLSKDLRLVHKTAAPAKSVGTNLMTGSNVPPFQAMPNLISRISTGDTIDVDGGFVPIFESGIPKVNLMGHTVEELALAANVSVDAIKQAIAIRQQQLLTEHRANQIKAQKIRDSSAASTAKTVFTTSDPKITATTALPTTAAFNKTALQPSTSLSTSTTTTTMMPTKKPTMKPTNSGKVMNAPKEYYPVGYDKNFDDNFTSKVELPPTTFNCGDQKHFPGLYGDVDLGCMVFHVCAFTDDGLIMKSFLCPESTLFDQTILKCNWWFYVDCKTSRNLYDSNIPISKSYQLMKSLTYFSNYHKISTGEKEEFDIQSLKNTMIAENLNNNYSKISSNDNHFNSNNNTDVLNNNITFTNSNIINSSSNIISSSRSINNSKRRIVSGKSLKLSNSTLTNSTEVAKKLDSNIKKNSNETSSVNPT